MPTIVLGLLLNIIAILGLWIILPYRLDQNNLGTFFLPLLLFGISVIIIPVDFLISYLFTKHRRTVSKSNRTHPSYTIELLSLISGVFIGTVTSIYATSFFSGISLNRTGIIELVPLITFPLYISACSYIGVKLAEIVFSKFDFHKTAPKDILTILILLFLLITPLFVSTNSVDSFIDNYLENQSEKIQSQFKLGFTKGAHNITSDGAYSPDNQDFTIKIDSTELTIPVTIFIPIDGFYNMSATLESDNNSYPAEINFEDQSKKPGEKLMKGWYITYYKFTNTSCDNSSSGTYKLNFKTEWNTTKNKGILNTEKIVTDKTAEFYLHCK